MSLNETTSGERLHIAFFGRRNAGKSSLVNAVTGQSLSVVSDVAGTTTDPVKKAMELLKAAVSSDKKYDYVVALQNLDYPIKSNSQIEQFFTVSIFFTSFQVPGSTV